MVLGAMSVGANTPPSKGPAAFGPAPLANQENFPVGNSMSQHTLTVSPSSTFFDRQILTSAPPQSARNKPLPSQIKILEVKTNLNPLNITITTPIDEALLKAGDLLLDQPPAEVPDETPATPIEETPPEEIADEAEPTPVTLQQAPTEETITE
jgi:hypothetical protein